MAQRPSEGRKGPIQRLQTSEFTTYRPSFCKSVWYNESMTHKLNKELSDALAHTGVDTVQEITDPRIEEIDVLAKPKEKELVAV